MTEPTRSQAQQTAISEALWRVMSRGGPQDVTLRAVAAEAGCTTGLVTSRFPNKRALLLHARQMLHERTAARMLETVQTKRDPEQALCTVLMVSALRADWDPRNWLGFIAATLSDEELRAFHVEANRHFVGVVEGLVQRIRPDWSASQSREQSVRLIGLVTGLAVLSTPDPELYSHDLLRRAFSDAVRALRSAPGTG